MSSTIVVVDYDPIWPELFEQEKAQMLALIGDDVTAIEHVGSTSVPGLGAKPVIDILIIVSSLALVERFVQPMESLGYEYRGENGLPGRHYFKKPASLSEHTYHLHIVEIEHEQRRAMLLFRDYLRRHPEAARQYHELKKELAASFGADRSGYTDAKEDFVRSILRAAEAEDETENGQALAVVVSDYKPEWPQRFEQEKARILAVLGDYSADIQHVGSTSVPGLRAKPTVDVLIGLHDIALVEQCIEPLQSLGYEYLGENGIPGRHFFRTPHGPSWVTRIHNVHMVEIGGEEWMKQTTFRDYLRSHPEVAREYGMLKSGLATTFATDKNAYHDGKSDFIVSITAKARQQGKTPDM